MNVLNEVMEEDTQKFCYPDEKIASNIYQISLSHPPRALAGVSENERIKREKSNEWLADETEKVHEVPILDFDNIIKKLSNGRHSCDGFFYNFEPNDGELHYLVEMKNVKGKKDMLKMLKDEGKNGIYDKLNDSVLMIKSELEFGGLHEHDDIIVHTHFFIVYPGKNDVPTMKPILKLKKTEVDRDGRNKQKRAGRKLTVSDKEETEIYVDFGNKVHKLGLAACDESLFPGEALPRARKVKGRCEQRQFSIFSARDFAKIIDSGFFTDWKWGSYQNYFANRNEDITL